MRKLFNRIEDIYIVGSPMQLTDAITAMDIAMQNISQDTEKITGDIINYAETNKGTQYDKVVGTVLNLREVLREASIDMNDMQNQIVEYQNKVLRYEDMATVSTPANAYMVQRKTIDNDIYITQFNLEEMKNLVELLKNYKEGITYHISVLVEKKNNLESVWKDSQYYVFSEYIDEVYVVIVKALEVFEEYTNLLRNKIKELN